MRGCIARLPHGERRDDGGSHQTRVADRGERDDGDAVGEVLSHHRRRAQREAGLADAAGAGQGEERNVLTQKQVAHGGQLPLPSNERGAWQRYLVGGIESK